MPAAWPLLLTLATAAGGNDSKFEIVLSKPADAVSVREQEQRTVFVVASQTGIGGATIKLAEKQSWPKQVAMRLTYAEGRGFAMLEGLSITLPWLQARGSQGDTGRLSFYLPGADGKYDPRAPAAGTLNVGIVERDGAIEISLPPHLLRGAAELKLDWIDAYR